MSYGEDQILEEHYVPRRSQRTRAVLTFFAQDGETATLCYANADLSKAEQSHEIIRFCEFWQTTTGQKPRLLVFDSTLTTHAELAELDEQDIGFITLRRGGGNIIKAIEALPDSAWTPVRLERPGKHRDVTVTDSEVTLDERSFRQLAIKGLGRDQPTLLLTNRRQMTRQATARALRQTLADRKPALRPDPRLPPRRALLPSPARRRRRRHPVCHRRQHLPPLRAAAQRLPDRHPRHHLPPLHQDPGPVARHPRAGRGPPRTTHPHPHPPRRRLPPAHDHRPLVGRTPNLPTVSRLPDPAKLGQKGVPVIQVRRVGERVTVSRAGSV
jgi:hypothetical protein